MMDEFAVSFTDVDRLYLMDIYPAGEQPIEGITAEVLFRTLKRTATGTIRYEAERREMAETIVRETEPGDVLLTLGAGDVYKLGEEILHGLRNMS